MKRLETLLLQLTLFLIPANLAFHWYHPQAYVNGRLIDYLIPRLYLSDIFILILLLIWLSRTIRLKLLTQITLKPFVFWPLCLFAYLIIISLFSPLPLPSLWFAFKLLEMALFLKYLISTYSRPQFFRLAFFPLTLSLMGQLSLALYQYINQSSFIGYIFFGEPVLQTTAGLATGIFSGGIRVLSYGTTPHPNVLAGFAVVTSLLLFCGNLYNPKIKYLYYHSILIIMSSCLIIYLTRSLAGLVGLLVGLVVIYFAIKPPSIHLRGLLPMSIMVSILVIILLSSSVVYHSYNWIDIRSLTNRYKLNYVAFSLFSDHSLVGVGPNLFIPTMIKLNLIPTAPFLQPAHNIYFLWLTETGLIGTLLLFLSLFYLFKSDKNGRSPLALAPLIAVLVIGLVDHYPLTLQTGQFLLVIPLYLALSRPNRL